MKKRVTALLFAVLLAVLPLGTFAETEPAATEPEQDASCICGRPYHTSDGKDYLKYDCVKCKRNYLLCICDCWCGHSTYTEETQAGTVKYCTGCNRSCTECICADKTEMLSREQQLSNGTLSVMGVQKPTSAVAVVFATVFLAALAFAGAYGYLSLKKQADSTKKLETARPARPNEDKTAQAVKWDIAGRLPAIVAYEITAQTFSPPKGTGADDLFREFDPVMLELSDLAALASFAKIPREQVKTVNLPEQASEGARLAAAGYAQQTKVGTLRLTEQGERAAAALFTPENFSVFGTKSGKLYSLCQKQDVRILFAQTREGYAIVDYLDKKSIVAFVKNRVCAFDKGQGDAEPLNTQLTYAEWYLLLVCMSRNENVFSVKELKDREKIQNLKNGLGRMKLQSEAAAIDDLFKNDESLLKTLASLVQKGFIMNTGKKLSMTPATVRWLTPHDLSDTVFFENTGEDGARYTMLFIQKRKGVVCLYDNSGQVRLVSAAGIPWSAYLH